jgi:uncharacterized protein YndB with AHSA1/START domain
MSSDIQDTIERQIEIRASKERVFDAISDVKKIVQWFPNAVEGVFEIGARPIFDFGDGYRFEVYIEEVRPYDYFAYRWVPGNEDGSIGFMGDVLAQANTLVEFHLQEANGVTTVKLKESGFASLPAVVAKKQIGENSKGWDFMLDRLQKLLPEE